MRKNPVQNIKLKRYLNILNSIFKNIYLLSNSCPKEWISRIEWVQCNDAIINKKTILDDFLNFIYNQIFLSQKIFYLKRKYDYDAVIFFGAYPIPMLVSKILKIKVIRFQAGSPVEGEVYNNLFSKIVQIDIPSIISDIIIVQSRNCIEFQHLKRYQKKVIVKTLHYIDINEFNILKGIQERPNNIGFLGYLSQNKGILDLHLAINLISNNNQYNMFFLIAGNGPYFKTLKNKVKNNRQVKMLGWLNDTSLNEYLNTIKILILPSYSEAVPHVLLEAMASGAIVLASPVGGVKDIITHSETGFILRDRSDFTIKKTLESIINRTDLITISKNARKFVISEYSFESIHFFYMKVFNKLLNNDI